jgi:chaperone modulatory protein CbpM
MMASDFSDMPCLVVEREVSFSLAGLCRACGSDRRFLIALVDEGVLQPSGADPDNWQFSGQCLRTARTAASLARDLEMDLAGIALVLELLQRIETLTSSLRRAGID